MIPTSGNANSLHDSSTGTSPNTEFHSILAKDISSSSMDTLAPHHPADDEKESIGMLNYVVLSLLLLFFLSLWFDL
jgi:hypothetical protein